MEERRKEGNILKGKTVVIIEDPGVAKFLEKVLKKQSGEGVDFHLAHSPEAGFETLKKLNHVDLLILGRFSEIGPPFDAIYVAKFFREKFLRDGFFQAIMVVTSGYNDLESWLGSVYHAFLPKPFRARDLWKLIEFYLSLQS